MSTAPSTTAKQPLGVTGGGAAAQRAVVVNLGTAIDTAGTGGAIDVTGISKMTLFLHNSGSDTIAVNVQYCPVDWSVATDSSPWESMRMSALGAAGALTFVVGAQTIAATTVKNYQLTDIAPTIRIVTSTANAGCSLDAWLLLMPQA